MAGTDKLYWEDSRATSFETAGARLASYQGKTSIVLDRSLFYPEGGGQLGDSGVLVLGDRSVRIADTQIDDDGTIHHLFEDPGAFAGDDPALAVKGTIDEARRRDHTAQHTAQHALSRALADIARAETVSARLGATTCTIDVARPGIPDAELHRAEDLVNALVTSDVPVRALYPSAEELAKLPLRKQPKVESGVIRIIDIDGFDMTPCGGTHCVRTAQIGQARIVGLEKYKGMLRITFHAGLRALADARTKHDLLATLAADLTCGVLDVPSAVGKLRAELKSARTQLETARAELARLAARAALAALPADATAPIVLPVLREGEDVVALRLLAGELVTDPRVLVLAGSADRASGELVVVVQRGAGVTFDCGAFVKRETTARGGRGGGRPERAEGRFPRGTELEALAEATRTT